MTEPGGQNPRVAVWDYREVPGFDRNNTDVTYWPMVPLLDALTRHWPTDAHCTRYEIQGDDEIPRLRKAALDDMIEADSEPLVTVLLLDIDNPNHQTWDDLATAKKSATKLQKKAVKKLRKQAPKAGIYTTRAGSRLVWVLETPIPVSVFNSWARAFIKSLDIPGLDRTSNEWTRCFRLPFVMRDGQPTDSITYFRPLENAITLPVDLTGLDTDIPPGPTAPYEGERPVDPLEVDWALWNHLDMRTLAGRLLSKLARGGALAERGERNTTVFSVIRSISYQLKGPEGVDPETLYAMVGPSAQTHVDMGSKTTMEMVWSMCVATAEKERASREATAALDDAPAPPPAPTSPELPFVPTVYACGAAYFVRDDRTQRIFGPYAARNLISGVRDCQPDYPTHTGEKGGALLGPTEIMFRWGTTAQSLVYEMGREEDAYSRDRSTLYLRSAVPVQVQAERSTLVEEWLGLLGGSDPDALLDWLATIRRTQDSTAAIYLQDDYKGGAGKGMLALSLGGLWGSAPVAFKDAIGKFNAGMVNQPVVHLDEGYGSERHATRASSLFRSLVGESAHRIEQKYAPVGTLKGCPRVIITANNADALHFTGARTRADIEAITGRILHITVDRKAKSFLQAVGGRAVLRSWVQSPDGGPGGIARHVAWLEATRTVAVGDRYLVEGTETEYHRGMTLRTGITVEVILAVCNGIGMGPDQPGMGISIDPERRCAWVNASAIHSRWKLLVGNHSDTNKPSIPAISATLKNLQRDQHKASRQIIVNGRNARHWAVPRDLLERVADEQGLTSLGKIKALFRGAHKEKGKIIDLAR